MFVRSPRPTIPIEGTAAEHVNKRITVHHPGYTGTSDILIVLLAADGLNGGLDLETTLTICAILADNRFDGYISRNNAVGASPVRSDEDLLASGEYFFHVPHPAIDGSTPTSAGFACFRTFICNILELIFPTTGSLASLMPNSWDGASHGHPNTVTLNAQPPYPFTTIDENSLAEQRAEKAIFERIRSRIAGASVWGLEVFSQDEASTLVTSYDLEEGPLLIRGEYELIYDAPNAAHCAHDSRAMDDSTSLYIVNGQPSCGKTVFMKVLRSRLIYDSKPILYASRKQWYWYGGQEDLLAVPDNTDSKETIRDLIYEHNPWIIYDSLDVEHSQTLFGDRFLEGTSKISGVFCKSPRGFTVFSTLPNPYWWKIDSENMTSNMLIMNPWSIDEILTVKQANDRGILCIPQVKQPTIVTVKPNLGVGKADEVKQEFEMYGPFPTLQIPFHDAGIHTRREEVQAVIDSLSLGGLLHKWIKLRYDSILGYSKDGKERPSQKLYIQRRVGDFDFIGTAVHQIEGAHIQEQLRCKFVEARRQQLVSVEDMLTASKEFSSGWLSIPV
ncbi:hypothetical protein LTR42_000905 [Elasticomyces elasticus]|nr:hypothetical protein LTR42_000905 [Elasticomyces elasticus]